MKNRYDCIFIIQQNIMEVEIFLNLWSFILLSQRRYSRISIIQTEFSSKVTHIFVEFSLFERIIIRAILFGGIAKNTLSVVLSCNLSSTLQVCLFRATNLIKVPMSTSGIPPRVSHPPSRAVCFAIRRFPQDLFPIS